jgi:hypothetical protein
LLQLRAISEGKLAITTSDAAALQCSPLRLQQLLMAMLVTKDSKLQRNNQVLSDEKEMLKRQMETLRQQIHQQIKVGDQLSQELAEMKVSLRLKDIECEHERVGKKRAEERVEVLERSMRTIRGGLAQVDDPSASTPVVVIDDDDDDDDDEEQLDAPEPLQERKRKRGC